jgi:hypothetical protein
MAEQILIPGDYIIELAFNRELNDGALVRALNAMGFVNVTPDNSEAEQFVETGAIASTIRRPAAPPPPAPRPLKTLGKRKLPTGGGAASAPRPAAPVAMRPLKTIAQARAANPAMASRAVAVALKPPGLISSNTGLPGAMKPVTPGNTLGKRKLPTPGSLASAQRATPAPKPGTPEYVTYLESVLARAIAAKQSPAIINALRQKIAQAKGPQGKALGKRKKPGEAGTAPADDGGTAIGPDAAPGDGGLLGLTPEEMEAMGLGGGGASPGEGYNYGGGGGGGGGGAPADDGGGYEAAPPPEETPMAAAAPPETPIAADPTQFIVDLWRRWAEWGSPFAQGPQVSGEGDNRFRFVARLKKAIRVRDLPGQTWLYIRRLSIPAFGGEDFRGRPFKVLPNKYYEFRVISRDKSTPTREEVKKALVAMGFAPMKLASLKRHMRVPFRPNVSATLWTGFAQWGRGKSVIVSEDPLFFIDLKEVIP